MLDPFSRMLMQDLLFLVQAFHLPLQPLHTADHHVQRVQGLGGVAGSVEGSIGRRFEGGEDDVAGVFDMLLHRFEILAGELAGKAKDRLLLFMFLVLAENLQKSGGYAYKEEVTLRVEFGAG